MSRKSVVLVSVLVFLLAGASVFGLLMWKHAGDLVASPVSFKVNAQGWSADTSSPVPLHITGETVRGEKVDEKYFVGRSEDDLRLKPGTYTAEVYASPVNADGGMYKASEPVEFVVPENTDKEETQLTPTPSVETSVSPSASVEASSVPVVTAEIDLSVIPAYEISDEDIEKAQAAMKEAGLTEEEINAFIDAAHQIRQEAEQAKEAFAAIAGTYKGDSYSVLEIALDGSVSTSLKFCKTGTCVFSNFTGRLDQLHATGDGTYEAVIHGAYANEPGTSATCPPDLPGDVDYSCSNIGGGFVDGDTVVIYAEGQPKPNPDNFNWYGSPDWTAGAAVGEPETGPLQHMALVAGKVLYLRQ